MDLNQANIDNLTSLWKKYGAEQKSGNHTSSLLFNTKWPFRSWLEDLADLENLLQFVPDSHYLSVWPFEVSPAIKNSGKCLECTMTATLRDKGWHCEFEQTAMYLNLATYNQPEIYVESDLILKPVSSDQELNAWLRICGEAFGYQVDKTVIENLLTDNEIQILLGWVSRRPALTALILSDGTIAGLHQMGVSPEFQGQGLSKMAMLKLLLNSKNSGIQYMALQASEVGLPVYKKLGFVEQFRLKHFKRMGQIIKKP